MSDNGLKLSPEALKLAKKISHEIWEKYDDTYGYRTEKQTRNAEVSTDHPDNIWFFWGQFDGKNQTEFVQRIVDIYASAGSAKQDEGAKELFFWALQAYNDHRNLF